MRSRTLATNTSSWQHLLPRWVSSRGRGTKHQRDRRHFGVAQRCVRRTETVSIWAAPLIAVVLLASACGSGSGSGSERVGTSDDDGGGASSESEEVFEPPPSPLTVFFGVDPTGESQQAAHNARERKRQDWITQCMADEGFTYRYSEQNRFTVFERTPDGEPEWGSRAYAEKYGLGISTQAFEQAQLPSGLIGGPNWSDELRSEDQDPNSEYLDSLPEAERDAFYSALYGNDPGYQWDPAVTDAENEEAMQDYYDNEYEPTGCSELADQEIGQDDPYIQMWESFGDELETMYERVEADPEMVAAEEEISRCVGDQGLAYSGQRQMYDDWQRRMDPVYDGVTWPGHSLTEAEIEAMTEEELNAIGEQPPAFSDEAVALLTELQAEEIALGVALYDCGNADLAKLRSTIHSTYEQQFIDANRAELETMRNS